MDDLNSKIVISRQDIKRYNPQTLSESAHSIKMILENPTSKIKYVGYAYQLYSQFNTIKECLERELNIYANIKQEGLTAIEEVFQTEIGKKIYLVIMRTYRQTQTLAEIASNTQRKGGLDALSVAKKIANALQALENKGIYHNNLPLNEIEYCRGNVILQLPVFPSVKKQLLLFEKQIRQSQKQKVKKRSLKMREDVRCYMQSLIALSVEGIAVDNDVNLFSANIQKIIKKIRQPRIRELINYVLEQDQKDENMRGEVNFKQICYFLQHGQGHQDNQRKSQSQVDILGLSLIASSSDNLQHPSAHGVTGKPIYQTQFDLQSFFLAIKAYKQCLIFQMASKIIHRYKIVVVLTDKTLPYPANKYFKGINQYVSHIVQKKVGRFQVTDSGILAFYVPWGYAVSLETSIKLQVSQSTIDQNGFPENCVGYLYEGQTYAGRGFLINGNMVITAGCCLYDRKKRRKRQNLVFSVLTCRKNCKKSVYPPEYQTCDEKDAWRYNYGIVNFGSEYIDSQLHINVLYNYDEQQMMQQISNQPLKYNLKYLINCNSINKNQLHLSENKIKNLNSSIERGSPIFVSVGNRLAVIGMKTERKQGLLFNQTHFQAFYRYIQSFDPTKEVICSSRIYSAHLFDFYQEELNNLYFQNDNQKILGLKPRDLQLKCTKYYEQKSYIKICLLIQKEVKNPSLDLPTKVKYYELIIKMYEVYYNPQHWKIPHLLLEFAIICSANKQYKMAQNLIDRAINHEKKYGRQNPYILANLYFTLANISQINSNYSEAENYYNNAITIFEKMNNIQLLGKCFSKMGFIFKVKKNIESSCSFYEKALKLQQNLNYEGYYTNTLIQYSATALEFEKFTESGQSLQKLLRILKKSNYRQANQKLKADQLWKSFQQKMKESDQKDIEVLGIADRIQKNYYP